ncbi:ABC transporter permease [Tsukamurella sp. 8F]|uniref:ABC transporter permease n=1 Tax=unclassified Tsukamurella TaxID=2633480 RepID=UPI0023B99084|nr:MULTISPECIES: ABC transporter permease [unclassified Tsukamurella]MDF0529206.1 ABC transporter permease [Tsukamurella sp. 8J]MDF0585391.1 ABC transporter permease [Tsukamurella sp. 8F]
MTTGTVGTTIADRHHLRRAVRSELAKLSPRSPALSVAVPLAVLIPLSVNAAIAAAAAQNRIDGSGGMDTNNSAYWILVFSTFILMAGAAFSMGAEFGNGTVDTVFAASARRWTLPVAKAIVFGAVAAVAGALATLIVVGGLPVVFPEIWGRVDLFSATGVALWCGVAYYMVLATLLGIGSAVFLPRAGLVMMGVLLWKFGVETAVTFVPGDAGMLLQRLSPFRNAELGVGQMSTIDSLFGGRIGSLAFFTVLCVAVFAAAVARLSRMDVMR